MSDTTMMMTLAEELRAAASAYYDSSELTMSDAEYDAGIESLSQAAADDPDLAEAVSDLLGQVAAGQSAGGEVKHPSLMGSMNKTRETESLRAFVLRVGGPVIVEPKLDGLAVRGVYESGSLTLCATRGDGHSGEDVTAQARNLGFLPQTLGHGDFEIRGEVIMNDSGFIAAQELRANAGAAAFVNQRNAAAGILRKGDKDFSGLLGFVAYDVICPESPDLLDDLKEQVMTAQSVTDLPHEPTLDPDEVIERVKALEAARQGLGFPIDGAVIKATRPQDRQALGQGSKAPNWALAYKYEAEESWTVVKAVHTRVGRTGRLSIQVEVEPVFVGGTTITYASGHNVSWMLERGIRVGDTVSISRAGDVIPYLGAVLHSKRPHDSVAWEPPALDPMGQEWDKSSLLWRSTSPEITALPTIEYGLSRDALDVDLIGPEIAAALVESGLIGDIADVFSLRLEDLESLRLESGRVVGSKTGAKIMDEIEAARSADWNRIITALGIRAVGRTVGRRLAQSFPTARALMESSVEDLSAVEGIGAKKAQVIRQGLDDIESQGIMERLSKGGVTLGSTENADTGPKPLDGQTVVVTGKVGDLNRTQVQERIEALGGRASSSVSSATTLLVAEESSTSSKVKKAKSLGITMMDPQEFIEL